jgi:hypothetical protein
MCSSRFEVRSSPALLTLLGNMKKAAILSRLFLCLGCVGCRWHLVSGVAAIISATVAVPGVAAVAVSQTSADQRAYDQTADNTWSVIAVSAVATVTPVASAKPTAISTSIAAASEASAKSTSVKASTKAASMKAATTKATTGECRGRCGKRNCQTGSSYRSIFLHSRLLHYGLNGEQP